MKDSTLGSLLKSYLPSDHEQLDILDTCLASSTVDFPEKPLLLKTQSTTTLLQDIVQLLAKTNNSILLRGYSRNVFWQPNSALLVLRSNQFDQLHCMIGTELFRFLLLNSTLYIALNNDNYQQVTGPVENIEWKPRVIVPTRLYSNTYTRLPGFAEGHILNKLKSTQRGAKQLLKSIFGVGRIPPRLLPIIPLLKALLKRHHSTRYGLLLGIHCPLYDPCSYWCVSKFVMSCLLNILPKSLLNIQVLRDMVDHWIRLKRHQPFNLKSWTQRFKLNDVCWLKRKSRCISDSEKRRQLMDQLITWIFMKLMFPLLKNHFYCTETTYGGNQISMYRKPVWSGMTRNALSNSYVPLNNENRVLSQIPNLRFIPKLDSGLRPIVNMNAANKTLKLVHNVLRYELFENGKRHLLGSSVFSLGDVHSKLKPFILNWRQLGCPLVYGCAIDIKSAFDTILQEKLTDILFQSEEIFSSREYTVHSFHQNNGWKTFVYPSDNPEPFSQHRFKGKHSIVSDMCQLKMITRAEIQEKCKRLILDTVVRFNGSFYKQTVGIVQGSLLSQLFCCLYYGHLERYQIAHLIEAVDSLLMRFVDDSLYLTLDKSLYDQYIVGMNYFKEDYNAELNTEKTQDNPRLIHWYGLVVDLQTMQVYGDYSKYSGKHMGDFTPATSTTLSEMLIRCVQPKCVPLLLDLEINSLESVFFNVYQLFLLAALKFHCFKKKSDCIKAISGIVGYVASRAPVGYVSVQFLCCHAFERILKKKQSFLLQYLRGVIDGYHGSRELMAAINPQRHQIFLMDVQY